MRLSHSKNVAAILAGTLLVACAYYILQKPNGITAPGLGGIAVILAKFLSTPLGVIYFILNIPLFLIGYRIAGFTFTLLSFVGMGSLTLFLTFLSHLPTFTSPILGCIFGGLFSGIGIGMVIRAGGTTGGLDIASVVIAKINPQLTIGKTMMMINGCVLILTFVTDGLNHLILTFVSMIIAGKSVDWTLAYIQFKTNKEATL
ncbi:YitT family protein [Bacillaceae bacterium C204]|uniref:YitT family protein n=1 Tax=Neobacillus sp. 204 TaxID=3383351 RepID=UPI00397A628B